MASRIPDGCREAFCTFDSVISSKTTSEVVWRLNLKAESAVVYMLQDEAVEDNKIVFLKTWRLLLGLFSDVSKGNMSGCWFVYHCPLIQAFTLNFVSTL
jgi:hypothetical protein